jgi:hypothetical protein
MYIEACETPRRPAGTMHNCHGGEVNGHPRRDLGAGQSRSALRTHAPQHDA